MTTIDEVSEVNGHGDDDHPANIELQRHARDWRRPRVDVDAEPRPDAKSGAPTYGQTLASPIRRPPLPIVILW